MIDSRLFQWTVECRVITREINVRLSRNEKQIACDISYRLVIALKSEEYLPKHLSWTRTGNWNRWKHLWKKRIILKIHIVFRLCHIRSISEDTRIWYMIKLRTLTKWKYEKIYLHSKGWNRLIAGLLALELLIGQLD
jgi:hypothetical protein